MLIKLGNEMKNEIKLSIYETGYVEWSFLNTLPPTCISFFHSPRTLCFYSTMTSNMCINFFII